MFKIGNLGGVLHKDSTPILKFKFRSGMLVESTLLTDDRRLLPMELYEDGVDTFTLSAFFEARITPPTRQGINELLSTTPIKYYNPERMIRYNSGKCIHDKYWVQCDDDMSCWSH